MAKLIVTSEVSEPLRERGIDVSTRSVSLSRIAESAQAEDLSEPTNCHGFGRIRHFGCHPSPGWPDNPLPIIPARRFFGHRAPELIRGRAQVFQNSVCNWRCWYCYVPFSMLKGDPAKSEMIPVAAMVDWYLAEPDRPPILDLSGGQPDLTPEWVPWTIEALIERGAGDDVYLWSDDNLSNDFAFRYLSDDDWNRMVSHRGYGRVGCFKGFDETSFSFNTGADPAEFASQFDIFQRLHVTGIDLYAYITLTCPRPDRPDPGGSARSMLDRLSEIDERVPLRTVPLEVKVFTPTQRRIKADHESALAYQHDLIAAWNSEMESRFTAVDLADHGLRIHET
jgi:uncharacterized Fe-S cluster-containing radical SAM superfamily protein